MKSKLLNTLMLLVVSMGFFACNGVKHTEVKTSINSLLGANVLELDNQIWHVLQAANGDYWFGSNNNGVYHLHNNQLLHITTDDGLMDNTIRGLHEDHLGNIYIETPIGVNKIDENQISALKVNESAVNDWQLNPNDLWFNCMGNHLYRYDGEWLYELQLPAQNLTLLGMDTNGVSFAGMNDSPYAVYGIDKDKVGNVWIGTITAGAFRYDGDSFLWFGEQELSTLPDGRVPGVRSMLQDVDGYFWLSNFYSKYKIDPQLPNGYEKVKAVELPEEIVKDKILYFNSGLTDQEGNLWMTTYGGGVWQYDGKSLTNWEIRNEKEEVLIVSIYQDQNGTLWLGTNNDGVYQHNGSEFVKFAVN